MGSMRGHSYRDINKAEEDLHFQKVMSMRGIGRMMWLRGWGHSDTQMELCFMDNGITIRSVDMGRSYTLTVLNMKVNLT